MLSRRTTLATAKLATACFEYHTFAGSRGTPTLHVRTDWFADLLFEKDFDLSMVNVARSLYAEGGSIKAFILQLHATACSSAAQESSANHVLVKLGASLLEYAHRPREQTRVPIDRATVAELVACLETDGFLWRDGELLRVEVAPRPQTQHGRSTPASKDHALDLLRGCLEGIGPVQLAGRDSVQFEKWWRDTDLTFARLFGETSSPRSEFKYIGFGPSAVTDIDDPQGSARVRKEALDRGLVSARGLLETMAEQVELHWPAAAREGGASSVATDGNVLNGRFDSSRDDLLPGRLFDFCVKSSLIA